MSGRRAVVVHCGDPVVHDRILHALRAVGVGVMATSPELVDGGLPDVDWAVVDSRWLDHRTPPSAALASPATLVAYQCRADAAASWRAFRAGALPWAPSERPQLPETTTFAAHDAPAAAIEALHADVAGASELAWQLLARIASSPGTAEACAALVEAGARTFERFRGRARHPVALDVLVSHLTRQVGPLDGPDFSWWWTMTEQMAFVAAGVALPPVAAETVPDALVGAFHAAGTVARFTARRQWRNATTFLEDFLSTEPVAGLVV